MRAALHKISLHAVQQALHRPEMKGTAVSGTLNGTVDAAWKGDISNMLAHSDLTVQAAATSTDNPSAAEVPVNGAIHATYDGARKTLALRNTTVRLPSATLSAQGEVGDHSSLEIQAIASDLHQLVMLASSFRTTQAPPPAI